VILNKFVKSLITYLLYNMRYNSIHHIIVSPLAIESLSFLIGCRHQIQEGEQINLVH
jgi:hypothetical protein